MPSASRSRSLRHSPAAKENRQRKGLLQARPESFLTAPRSCRSYENKITFYQAALLSASGRDSSHSSRRSLALAQLRRRPHPPPSSRPPLHAPPEPPIQPLQCPFPLSPQPAL